MNNIIEKSRTILVNRDRFAPNIVSLAVNYLIANDRDFDLDNLV